MTKEQYARMDKRVFIFIEAALIYMTVFTGYEVFGKAAGTGATIQFVVSTITCITALLGFIFLRGRRICGSILTGSGALNFLVMMCIDSDPSCYVFAFPILIASIIYLNKRFALCGNSVILISNLIYTIKEVGRGDVNGETVALRWIITLLICINVYVVMEITQIFYTERLVGLKEAAQAQQAITEQMNETADQIITNFQQANETLGHLKECVNTNNVAINNIADSTESTSQAIQKQANMCGEIQENSDKAEKETAKVIELAKEATDNVEAGAQLMTGLKEQAEGVEQASKETVEATTRLTNRVDQVQAIVGDILKISSQTNLLALNASIEAARAGEAGRGFAVVAEEIRQLSEQTKEATGRITGIIEELIADAQRASESLDNSVESINKQTEMIDVTEQKFEIIDNKVSELTQSIHTMENTIKEIVTATGVISENISQLSATSEEVAASSEDGTKTAGEAVDYMEQSVQLLENIHELSQQLKTV